MSPENEGGGRQNTGSAEGAGSLMPSGWQTVALNEIAEVRLGRQRSPKRAVGEYMRPYMRAANVTWDGISLHDVKEMDFRPDEVAIYCLETGDILLAEASGSASGVGKPAIWRNEVPGACFQNTLIRVRAPAELVPFLHKHFLNDALTGRFARASRGVGIHHLGAKALSQWRTAIAPLPEQRRIVESLDSYLSRLDVAEKGLKRVEANLKRYRASVLKAAVEGRLVPIEAELARQEGRDYEPASVLLERILKERRRRWEEAELAKMEAKGKVPKGDKWKAKYKTPAAPDNSDLPELPEGWCWATCAQICHRLQTGPFGSSLHKSDYVEGGTPVINPQHLQNCRIEPSRRVCVGPATVGRLSAFSLVQGQIVLGRRGEMGRCAVVTEREDGWLLGTGSLSLSLDRSVQANYFAWVLRSPRTVRSLEGESVGTTMTNLNQKILLTLPVPLAPAQEQVRVVAEIERHLSVIGALGVASAAQAKHCGLLCQSILKWAFEGRLVDQDPNDEPASALLERIKSERPATRRRRGRERSAQMSLDI